MPIATFYTQGTLSAAGIGYVDGAPAFGTTTVQGALDVLKAGRTPTATTAVSAPLPAYDESITVDTTGGVVALTLPAPTPGRQFLIQKINVGVNKITLNRNGAESINGVAANYDLPGSELAQIGRWHAFADVAGNWWVG